MVRKCGFIWFNLVNSSHCQYVSMGPLATYLTSWSPSFLSYNNQYNYTWLRGLIWGFSELIIWVNVFVQCLEHSRPLTVNCCPFVYEMGKSLPHQVPERFQEETTAERSAASGAGLAPGPLAVLIIIVGNRPKVNYEYDIVNATLCHCAPISSFSRAANRPWDERTGILLSSLSCLACDQKLGKKAWDLYRPDHLWITSFGWQSLRPRVIVLKTVTLTSVVMSFPPTLSSLLWFLSLGSCSRALRAEGRFQSGF